MIQIGIDNIPIQLLSKKYEIPICTKAVWDKLKICNNDTSCRLLLGDTDIFPNEQVLLTEAYKAGINKIREQLKLTVPYYPSEDSKDTVKYDRYTVSDKLVSDYANMNIYEIDKISILEYWCLERDAFIYLLSRTEKGREYLNNAYRVSYTEMDENIQI